MDARDASPIEALNRYETEAAELAKGAQGKGTSHHRTYYVVGVAAILAGAAAGGLGFSNGDPILTGLGGVAASVLAGIQALFQLETKAQYHYAKAADYNRVRRTCIRYRARSEPPTQDELKGIEERLGETQARPFQPVGQ